MASVSSEEEDYMSDAFLAKCEDKRPGLVSNSAARKYKHEQKIKELNVRHQTKPRKQVEVEKRDEGLNSAIGTENKGFALLQKMGYKPGMALGKKGTGRTEPVPIKVRTGRGGLGQEAEKKRKQEHRATLRAMVARKKQKTDETSRKDFQTRQREKMEEKRAQADLYKSQKVCEQLDSTQDIPVTEPEQPFFWPKHQLPGNDEDEDEEKEEEEENEEEEEEKEKEEDISVSAQLEILTYYLRNTYLYCVWCGTTYDDQEDLGQNCPGDTAQAHDD